MGSSQSAIKVHQSPLKLEKESRINVNVHHLSDNVLSENPLTPQRKEAAMIEFTTESDDDPCAMQFRKALTRMKAASGNRATKPLAVLVRNGCGSAFEAYMKSLSPYFQILVPDDGIHDADPRDVARIPKLIEKSLTLSPSLLITNSRGVGYAHRALSSVPAHVSCRFTIVVLSSGSVLGPSLVEEHPGRVVCLHGHHDKCTNICVLREALRKREARGLQPAVLFEIMNRGHRKKHGWNLGGLAHWAVCQEQVQFTHEQLYFPRFPSPHEEARWRGWFSDVCQGDPSSQMEPVNGWENG